jgi:ankyrin repeat protein
LLLSALFEAFSSRYPGGKKGFGAEALMRAIESKDASVMDALLKVKLDVNSYETQYGSRGHILLLAINYSRENPLEMNQMSRRLLDAGADAEAVGGGKTALLEAIDVENLPAVKLLLSRGSDVNRPARRGLKRTPLQQACEQDSFHMVEFLLDNGADVHAPPAVNGGATALQLAAIQGSVRIVRLLLDKGADIHAAPAVVHGRTALEGAAEHGRVSVLNILLAEGAAGYSVEEIKSAKAYAEKERHRGCEERLKLALFRFGEAGELRALLGL